jgi:hypothetical protein
MTKSKPEPKLTNDQVRDIIEHEGLGYAIADYLPASRIKSKRLAEMWQVAADVMNEIRKELKLEE